METIESLADIKEMFRARVEGCRRRMPASELLNEILANADMGDEVQFSLAKAQMRQMLRGWLQHRRGSEESGEDDGQMHIPGTERLQQSYIIQRDDGESVIVPLNEMTKGEWQSKLGEMRAQHRGLATHIRELERWGLERWPEEMA